MHDLDGNFGGPRDSTTTPAEHVCDTCAEIADCVGCCPHAKNPSACPQVQAALAGRR